jgi:hypothetical protein
VYSNCTRGRCLRGGTRECSLSERGVLAEGWEWKVGTDGLRGGRERGVTSLLGLSWSGLFCESFLRFHCEDWRGGTVPLLFLSGTAILRHSRRDTSVLWRVGLLI